MCFKGNQPPEDFIALSQPLPWEKKGAVVSYLLCATCDRIHKDLLWFLWFSKAGNFLCLQRNCFLPLFMILSPPFLSFPTFERTLLHLISFLCVWHLRMWHLGFLFTSDARNAFFRSHKINQCSWLQKWSDPHANRLSRVESFNSNVLVAGPGLVACNLVFEQSNEKQYYGWFFSENLPVLFPRMDYRLFFLATLHSCLYIFSCVSDVLFGKLLFRNAQLSLSFV